jgi:surface carbohydrate biosynthesis protein
MQGNKVVIPVEIRNRELSAKLFLAVVLADRGYDVYLGNKIQHTALDKIDPDVYFETGARQQEERLRRCQENGVSTIILETEGQTFGGADRFAIDTDKKTLEYTDCYCAWGRIAKDTVAEISPETRIEVTGNPRFDLLQKPYRQIYAERANQLNDNYDNYILFNTNFNVNGEKSLEQIERQFDDGHPVIDKLFDDVGKQVKIFGRFLSLISETAEQFPNHNIIVRPHPSENPYIYRNCFYVHENIHIDKRFEVRPWILGSQAVIHNSCTTGVEAALLNTPVIAYVPNGWERLETPNEVSVRCTTAADVFDVINHHGERQKAFTLDTDTKTKLQPHIDNIEYLSAERIADVVDSVTANTNKTDSIETNNKLALRRAIVRTVGSKRFEELWVKRLRGESRHKFEYIATTTIYSIIEKFSDKIKPRGLTIDRLPHMVNGFRVRTVDG